MRARNLGSWLRASAHDLDAVGHHVGGGAAVDDADIARAAAVTLLDQTVPAAAHEVGDRERRDGDGAHAVLGVHAGVAGDAVDGDCHAISAGCAERQAVCRAAVEIERQLRPLKHGHVYDSGRRAGPLPPAPSTGM